MKNEFNFNRVQEKVRKLGYPVRVAKRYTRGNQYYNLEVIQNGIDRRSEERN